MIILTELKYRPLDAFRNSYINESVGNLLDTNDPNCEERVKIDFLRNFFDYLKSNIKHFDFAIHKDSFHDEIIYRGKLGILDYNARKGIFQSLEHLQVLIEVISHFMNDDRFKSMALREIEEIRHILKED